MTSTERVCIGEIEKEEASFAKRYNGCPIEIQKNAGCKESAGVILICIVYVYILHTYDYILLCHILCTQSCVGA